MSGSLHGDLKRVYAGRATRRYGLSGVSQLQHALQAAAQAERAGEPAALVVAALLHDVGHMIHEFGEDPAARGIDDRHEEIGADWLSRHFDPAVAQPVRLHVPAKRYLCAVESDYFGKLSPDSVRSLALQGGPMSAAEVAAFDRDPHAEAAKRLRRYDEAAKDPKAATPDFEHFLRFVEACARS